jgi:hypothetical protein
MFQPKKRTEGRLNLWSFQLFVSWCTYCWTWLCWLKLIGLLISYYYFHFVAFSWHSRQLLVADVSHRAAFEAHRDGLLAEVCVKPKRGKRRLFWAFVSFESFLLGVDLNVWWLSGSVLNDQKHLRHDLDNVPGLEHKISFLLP